MYLFICLFIRRSKVPYFVADIIDVFVRTVSQTMFRVFGQPYLFLLKLLHDKVLHKIGTTTIVFISKHNSVDNEAHKNSKEQQQFLHGTKRLKEFLIIALKSNGRELLGIHS